MSVVHVDVVGEVIGELAALAPPLYLGRRVGVHVARNVVRLARPHEHDAVAISRHARLVCNVKTEKFSPNSLPSVGPGADPGVQAVSAQVT